MGGSAPSSPVAAAERFGDACRPVLGTGLMMLLWYRRLAAAGMATGYFGVGTDNLLRLGIVCVIAGAVHVALSGVESELPALVEHRVIILAVVGGLYGALSGAWAMTGS